MGESGVPVNGEDMNTEDDNVPFTCGAQERHERLLKTDARYRAAHQRITASQQLQPSTNRITGHIRIPVVFHIIWKNQKTDYMTKENVVSQIDALNRDFGLHNKDHKDVPPKFNKLIGNPNISFFLTRRDETGQACEGILYTQTDEEEFSNVDPTEVKPSSGATREQLAKANPKHAPSVSKAWNRDRFLNVWVVPRLIGANGKSILGSASFPGRGPEAEWDGIVMGCNVFGTVNLPDQNLKPDNNLGRTLVHEVGHWLDLPHIFASDAHVVGDTPRQNEMNQFKPLYPKVSEFSDHTTNAEAGGDMFMNYMDYTDDDITVMFTQGQVDRMREALATKRTTVFHSSFNVELHFGETSFALPEAKTRLAVTNWHNDGNFDPALVAIKPSINDGNVTAAEVHVTKGGGITKPPEIITVNGLQGKLENYVFIPGNSRDQDVVAIRCKGAQTEFQSFNVRKWEEGGRDKDKLNFSATLPITLLPETGNNWYFTTGWWKEKKTEEEKRETLPDLFAIKKSKTTNGKVEMHVLEGKYEYRWFLAHKYTALDEFEEESAEFLVTDWNGDGTLDLVVIRKNPGVSWFVDILAGAADYRDFLVRTEIKNADLSTDFDYNFSMVDYTKDGRMDLVAIVRSAVDDGKPSNVHVIVLAG